MVSKQRVYTGDSSFAAEDLLGLEALDVDESRFLR
jgi:hypothetical protein